MKTYLSIAFCIISTFLFAQNFAGKWAAYNKDTSISIVLTLRKDTSGYKGVGDMAAAAFSHLQTIKTILKNDSLYLYFNQPIATIALAYNASHTRLSGYYAQNGNTVSLTVVPLKRPQTPQPPFAYQSDSLEYDNADKSVHLGATLTKPAPPSTKGVKSAGGGKMPVVILITGSGQQDRDETILYHKPYAILADYLTKKGIAVLRVDDRWMGKSKGDLEKATSASFAEDVLTSIAYLKTRNDIDTTKIGLIGHSEGGLISYLVYNQWPHVKFIVTLAGQGISGKEILIKQGTDPLKDYDSATYKAYYQLHSKALNIMANASSDSAAMAQLQVWFENWQKNQPDSILEAVHAKNINKQQYAFSLMPFVSNKWINYFLKTDPAPYIEKIHCPFLILNGDKDRQVDAKTNVPAIQKSLLKGGNKNVTTHVFKNMNHLFQHCNTGAYAEYGVLEESMAPEVMQTIADWIKTTGLK